MGSLFWEKVVNWTVVSNVTSSITYVIDSGRTEPITMFPATAKVASDRQTSSLRMTRSREMAAGADIVGEIFSIMTSIKTPKTLSEEQSWMVCYWDIKEMSRSGYYQAIVANAHNKGLVSCYCIFI